MERPIHFHSSDSRSCGSKEIPRRFSLDPNEITCPVCKNKDTFALTQQGRYVIKNQKGKK